MTREESEKYIKSKMCKSCSVYLGGGKCSDNCKVIEAIEALEQKPCEDAISRQAVMEHYSTGEIAHCHHISRNNLLDFIEQLPPVTPQPKMGHWILHQYYNSDGLGFEYFSCSECDDQNDEKSRYCPNCGAKMDEVEENGDK